MKASNSSPTEKSTVKSRRFATAVGVAGAVAIAAGLMLGFSGGASAAPNIKSTDLMMFGSTAGCPGCFSHADFSAVNVTQKYRRTYPGATVLKMTLDVWTIVPYAHLSSGRTINDAATASASKTALILTAAGPSTSWKTKTVLKLRKPAWDWTKGESIRLPAQTYCESGVCYAVYDSKLTMIEPVTPAAVYDAVGNGWDKMIIQSH